MDIYLPIAEVSVNIFLILGLGLAVGFLSGMFGVGGGFLMTPILIFIGIPPPVAVATQTNQIVASSASGALAHFRRKSLDLKMGLYLLAGGIAGSIGGVQLFSFLQATGQINLVISLCYVGFLGIIGALMLVESAGALWRRYRQGKAGITPRPRRRRRGLIDAMPFKVRFPVSGLYISLIPVIGIGALVGLLAALMGVGGGFVMVPAMIYILRMPTSVVIGTSLFQILFVTALTTFLQAAQNQTVDLVLAALLIIGGVIGAQFGARAGQRIRAEELRTALALMVLAVCLKLAFDLVSDPADMFELMETAGRSAS